MKIHISTINAKFIHKNNSIYQLSAATKDLAPLFLKEYHQKMDYEKISADIINEKADIYCFSVYIWNVKTYMKIITQLKKQSPNCTIIIGGPELGFNPQRAFTLIPDIDYLITGEGEKPLYNLLNHLLYNKPLIHTAISTKKIFNTNTLVEALANYNFSYLDDLKLEDKQIFYIEASRGCPYRCSYCISSLEKKVRKHQLANIFKQIDYAIINKVSTIKFLDRSFNLNDTWCITILEYIKKNALKTQRFQFEVNLETLSEKLINYLSTFPKNLIRFEVGIQSIYDEVNHAVNRKQNFQVLQHKLKRLAATNVTLHLDLIAGLPKETYVMFQNSFNAIFDFNVAEIQVGILKILSGTLLEEQIFNHNYRFSTTAPYTIIDNKYLTTDELYNISLVENIINRYYNTQKFPLTMQTVRKKDNPFNYFLNFAKFLHAQNLELLNYQNHDLVNYLYSYDNELRDCLIQDYYNGNKLKPKRILQKTFDKTAIFHELSVRCNQSLNYIYKYFLIEELTSSYYCKDFYTQEIFLIKKKSA